MKQKFKINDEVTVKPCGVGWYTYYGITAGWEGTVVYVSYGGGSLQLLAKDRNCVHNGLIRVHARHFKLTNELPTRLVAPAIEMENIASALSALTINK